MVWNVGGPDVLADVLAVSYPATFTKKNPQSGPIAISSSENTVYLFIGTTKGSI